MDEVEPLEGSVFELDRARRLREIAFRAESDPLYFKEQAGEVPEGTWLAKRQEIRDRIPY